jgi:putative ABC transport system permease protein
MLNLWPDLRYALRRLRRSPGFTAVAGLTLALGMAANAAIFSVADAVMLEPLPYAEPDTRVMVWSRWKRFAKTWVNPAEMHAYAERCPSLAEVAFWRTGPLNLTGGGEAVRVGAGRISANTFDVLGVRPALGRGFLAEEDRPGGPRVAVLGHELWQGRYAGDPAILGRRIELDGVPYEIVGVMPRGFALPTDFGEDAADPTRLWVPRAPDEEDLTEFGGHSDFGAARLAPGADAARANVELRAAVAALTAEGHIDREMEFQAFALSLRDDILGEHRPVVLLLAGAVGFLLLVACANVANLLLARVEGRQREVALRTALGASHRRLLRQLLAEGLVLALLAGGISLLLAQAGLAALQSAGPLHVPRAAAAVVDARTAAFALILSFAVTLLFALAPALHSLRLDLSGALKQGGARALGSVSRRRWRAALIVAETAFAVLLAVGAGLMARSLHNLGGIPLGFEPKGVLTAQITLPQALYAEPAAVSSFYTRLLADVRALPGVKEAGLLRRLPLGQTIGDWGLTVEDNPQERTQGDWQVASEGALEAMGLRHVSGRGLGAADTAEAPQVAIINETMARRFWPGRDPLGRRFRMGSPDRPWVTVVGVAGDVRHHGLTSVVKAQFFRPYAQFHLSSGNPPRSLNLVVKAAGGDPAALGAPLRAALQRLDPRIPLAGVMSLEEVVAASVATPRFAGSLLGLFAALALALAAVGVFGVLSCVVSERTPEIGLRVALGAEGRHLRRLVFGEGLGLVAAGVGAGLVLAFALTRVMRRLLHEVAPADPLTFLVVAAVLGLVGLAAAWWPARRASRVDPMTALRYE